MTKLLELELEGLPPSVNQMYRNARVNTRYKTEKTREFQEKVVALMKKTGFCQTFLQGAYLLMLFSMFLIIESGILITG